MKFLLLFAMSVFAMFATVAFGQDAGGTGLGIPWLSPDLLVKVGAWVVGIQAVAFFLGKALTEVAVHTENKYDNMAANALSKLAWFLGTLISRFGWGMPKQVVLHEAEKLKNKNVLS